MLVIVREDGINKKSWKINLLTLTLHTHSHINKAFICLRRVTCTIPKIKTQNVCNAFHAVGVSKRQSKMLQNVKK